MSVEKYLTLSDGRTLAYEDVGDSSSNLVVIFFHGVFGYGSAPGPGLLSPVHVAKNVHNIAPTLPGWGCSSPRNPSKTFRETLISDTTELITHLHPNTADLRIYISGGSYGTIAAQMIYGAPFDEFPLGRKIKGCLLLAPLSYFKCHKGYSKSMTWIDYISVGPMARYLPFQPIQRLGAFGIYMMVTTEDKAEALMRKQLFDSAPPEEREAFKRWREQRGLKEGELERTMAKNMFKSTSKTWAGFIEVPDVAHSDWGFQPNQLDDEHTKNRPMLIAASAHDDLGPDMANWLHENYRNSTLKWVPGKHLSTLYELDGLWAELLKDEPAGVPS
ncbi:AB hydrolase-1 domain-containing protein [Favolaschia claudopus]|uniref:AB hydrolase-1 domain-containing protein n=1 Tax=Favolaschia claudopus TaxID=2862362 RepID=A0AAW0D1A0_9AGAR